MKALVTGGGGFLGRRIVELLLESGHEVRFLARNAYPDVEALGARGFRADLREPDTLAPALEGMDVVFHVAGRVGFWGDPKEYWAINVDGTRHLLDAMERTGVPKLVYTSTPSVVGYDDDVRAGTPDLPYATHHQSPYPESKAAAEQMVRDANSRHVATVAIRPHLVFGPGDAHTLPRVIARARAGRLFVVGEGRNRVDFTYVDNAAWAHLDAEAALTGPDAPCAGKAYFVSNGEPLVLWEFVNRILEGLDIPPVRRRVPYGLARGIARAMEIGHGVLRLGGEPPLSRFLVDGLARDHTYDMEPTREAIGYRPRVPQDEGIARTIESLRSGPAL